MTIKSIIFDLDGVLVDTKLIHFNALNRALVESGFAKISLSEHINKYDGLSTKAKLKIFFLRKKILKNKINKILYLKKKYTKSCLKNEIKFNPKLYKLIKNLRKNYKLAVATNAVKETLNICLDKLRIKKFINFSISNNDVKNIKPHPEIYIRSILALNSMPKETMIIEDSYFGRVAAIESGCHLMAIKKINELNYNSVNKFIKNVSKKDIIPSKTYWSDSKLNILIPMAGYGSRFSQVGFTFPKPLIEIKSKPMIQIVIESLNIKGNYIFIIRKEHQEKYNIKSLLTMLQPNCKIIEIDEVTDGAACTTLIAKEFINNSSPLVIANSDQYIEWDSAKTMYEFTSKKVDGGILTFNSMHPKWSYARCDHDNYALEVAEKKVISNNATVGVYYWKSGADYVKFAEQMISKNIRVNNEFYVCPVFNEAIAERKKILIGKVNKMFGLGTPEDLSYFTSQLKQE